MVPRRKIITNVEEQLYSLIGQISYGETSHIEVYWTGLADSLLNLSIPGWNKPNHNEPVSEVLRSMGALVDSELVRIVGEMEELSEARGSTGSLDEEDLDKLQGLAEELENLFINFLEKISVKK